MLYDREAHTVCSKTKQQTEGFMYFVHRRIDNKIKYGATVIYSSSHKTWKQEKKSYFGLDPRKQIYLPAPRSSVTASLIV